LPNKLKKLMQYSPVEEDWLYRSPYFFFRTIASLIKLEPDLKEKLQFVHIGKKPHWMDEMVRKFNLQENVSYTGMLHFNEVNEKLSHSDLLLSTSVKIKGGKDYALASKTFDYIAQKKVVIGFVKPGAQSSFITNSKTGIVIDPDNISMAVEKMKEILYNGLTLEPDISLLNNYQRKDTAKKLSEIINFNISE
ncbi:MAG TPA: glycosyltransferase, partial [Flavobacteriales bacterium]|nr:glycosyltransferase [Flavobacteriales bacterium]